MRQLGLGPPGMAAIGIKPKIQSKMRTMVIRDCNLSVKRCSDLVRVRPVVEGRGGMTLRDAGSIAAFARKESEKPAMGGATLAQRSRESKEIAVGCAVFSS